MHLPSVKDLLYRLADDQFLMSQQQLNWLSQSPLPQESLLLTDMASVYHEQAMAYYSLLHTLGERSPDELISSRQIEQFRSCHLVETPSLDLGSHLMRNYLFESAMQVRWQALQHSAYAPLSTLARQFLARNDFFTGHSAALLKQLGLADFSANMPLQTALNQLYAAAFGVFEPTVFSSRLAKEDVQPLEDSLLKIWRTQTQAFLLECQLTAPAAQNFVDYFGGRSGHHTVYLASLL